MLIGAVIALGGATTIAGVLLPLATLPTGEIVDFWGFNQGFALLLIALSLITTGLGFTKLARFSFVPALLVGGIAGYGVNSAFSRIETARAEIQALIEGGPFGALAGNLLDQFQINDNWMLIFVGAGISTLGSLLAFSKGSSKQQDSRED